MEVPAPDADITVEGEEVKEEPQESKDGKDQTSQNYEVRRVNNIFFVFKYQLIKKHRIVW